MIDADLKSRLAVPVVDQLILNHSRHIEHEIEHHVSRSGPRITQGVMTRPTQQEYGITALVMWGMIQLANTIEASGESVEDWGNKCSQQT